MLARGMLWRCARFLDCLPAPAERVGRKGLDQRVQALADRNPPPGHSAIGLRRGDRRESSSGYREVEGMQHRQRFLELLLGLSAARDRKVHLAIVLSTSRQHGVFMLLLCDEREG